MKSLINEKKHVEISEAKHMTYEEAKKKVVEKLKPVIKAIGEIETLAEGFRHNNDGSRNKEAEVLFDIVSGAGSSLTQLSEDIRRGRELDW